MRTSLLFALVIAVAACSSKSSQSPGPASSAPPAPTPPIVVDSSLPDPMAIDAGSPASVTPDAAPLIVDGGAAPSGQTGQTKPDQTKPTKPSTPAGTPKLGDNCGANDACGPGQTCVKYYGIAGARGPEFKTCEIKCDKKQKCPSGTSCITIADGPGQVCR